MPALGCKWKAGIVAAWTAAPLPALDWLSGAVVVLGAVRLQAYCGRLARWTKQYLAAYRSRHDGLRAVKHLAHGHGCTVLAYRGVAEHDGSFSSLAALFTRQGHDAPHFRTFASKHGRHTPTWGRPSEQVRQRYRGIEAGLPCAAYLPRRPSARDSVQRLLLYLLNGSDVELRAVVLIVQGYDSGRGEQGIGAKKNPRMGGRGGAGARPIARDRRGLGR